MLEWQLVGVQKGACFMVPETKIPSIKVDNPAEGDCGYYSIEITLIPILLEELRKAASDAGSDSVADFLKSQRFFEYLDEPENSIKFPFLTKLYGYLKENKCRMGLPESSDPVDIEKQKELFQKWLLDIAFGAGQLIVGSPDDPYLDYNNTHLKSVLLPGVYLLRTLTANLREDALKDVIATLSDIVKNKERYELNLSLSADRARAFQRAVAHDVSGINEIMLAVLLKHMGQEVDSGTLETDTAKNKELNEFAEKFVIWWRQQNKLDKSKPVPETHEMQATFIACLYGNIAFDDKSMDEVKAEADKWWVNPSMNQGSVAIKVANLVKEMKKYAAETDLSVLANSLGGEIHIHGYVTGISEKRQLTVANLGGEHWVAYISPDDCLRLQKSAEMTTEVAKAKPTEPAVGVGSSKKDSTQIILEATKGVVRASSQSEGDEGVESLVMILRYELVELGKVESIKRSPNKKRVVENLIETLNPKGGKLTQGNIDRCKEQFMQSLPVLEKGMDDAGKSILGKVFDFFRRILHITNAASGSNTDAVYKKSIKTISDTFGVDQSFSEGGGSRP